MDLLCSPENATRPVEETRYFCDPGDRWDGGPFLTYPQRRGFLHMVPLSLRQYNTEVPYTGTIRPTSLEARQSILTTWLFFGLICEFLGSNRQERPDRPPDHPGAEKVIDIVYQFCIVTEQNGERFITGQPIMDFVHLVLDCVKISIDVQARLQYLSTCLSVASDMVNELAAQGIDRSLRFTIAALGEVMSHTVFMGLYFEEFGAISGSRFAFSWKSDHLTQDTPMRKRMLDSGWCKSDLNRADHVYSGLFTIHYLSLLDRQVPGRDHSACTETMCEAARINPDTFKLSHTSPGCDCPEFRINIDSIKDILRESATYPVLLFDPSDETELLVKPFSTGDEYIAISHVWADGLGNTRGNTLQRCQIARLRQLVYAVEEAVWARDVSQPRPQYHLWIDTLCCPVAGLEPHWNNIALMRMKTVYEQAAHVLVLDLSLSLHDAEELSPATLLLRIFGSSIWMRRLWTLQEGVLAKSTYFQFRDKPVHAESLLPQLLAHEDFRYSVMWFDLNNEFLRLSNLSAHIRSPNGPKIRKHHLYSLIQESFDFRTVSRPSDEPICVATLLGLDLAQILEAAGPNDAEQTRTEKRMCVLWNLLAEADGGIPARLPFIVETPMKTAGFGWAPSSFLRNNKNHGLGFPMHVARRNGISIPRTVPSGFITDYGLAVDFPGWVLKPKSLSDGLPMHFWDELLPPTQRESYIYFYDEKNDAWFRISGWHALQAPLTAGTRRLARGDSDPQRPFCSTIDTGNMALIRAEEVSSERLALVLLAEILEEGASPLQQQQMPGYRVRWIRRLMVKQVVGLDLLVLKTVRKIALEVASSQEVKDFIHAREAFGVGCNWFAAKTDRVFRDRVFQKLQDITAAAWKSIDGFATAVKNTVGEDVEDFLYLSVPRRFAHEVVGVMAAEDQRWYID